MSVPSSHSPHSMSPHSPSESLSRSATETESAPTSEELMEQRSQWLSQLLAENPQILALRERVIPWTGGYSFANVVHTDTTAVLSHINRHVILELVFQHLHAIGLHRTAETLQLESGHEFQYSNQPWDKTDLLLLVSLGVLPREDPWAIAPDPHHQFVEESLEEDFFASPYREDPSEIYRELLDPNLNAEYSSEDHTFSNLKAASLKRLIVLLATSTSDALPDDELYKFFLTLHSITSSHHFFEHLLALFDCHLLEVSNEETKSRLLQMQPMLRKNVINLLKKWINFHGLFIGRKTLKSIAQFLRRIVDDKANYANVEIYAQPILAQLPQLSYGTKLGQLSPPDVKPNIPDPQIIFKPTLKIVDPDPMEVARQITLIFHSAFKAVHSREFVVALGDQKISHQTPTLAEFFDFGERLTLLTLETIAMSSDRAPTINRLLEIATHLESLGNFDALACVLRALKRDEVASLPEWSGMAPSKDILKQLWEKSGDDPSALDSYNSNVISRFEGWQSTIPNLKTELKSVKPDSSPSFIGKLINWAKRRGISEKTAVLYRFQNKPYNFWAIPQIQSMVNRVSALTEKQILEKLDQVPN